mgnify:CR=1 FL=1
MCSGWDLTALDSFILCVEYVPRSFCVSNCLWGKICSSYGMTETVQNMESFDLCICCGLIKYCTYHVVLIPFEKFINLVCAIKVILMLGSQQQEINNTVY